MKRLLFLLPSLVTLRVEAVCVSYNQSMANNGSCTESKPGCCMLFPDSAGTFDDGAGGCDCCCSSCADNEAACAQDFDMPKDFCTPGDCWYTTTMDVTNADFDPQVADVVKFFLASAGTTYTATNIETIISIDGKTRYKIEYVDETTHMVTRSTTIDTLSPMPFDPQLADVVKFHYGGTTYTATIMHIEEDVDTFFVPSTYGKKYKIEYVDESTHAVQRTTTIDTLSPMPIQMNHTKFCECHLQSGRVCQRRLHHGSASRLLLCPDEPPFSPTRRRAA